MNGIGTPLLTSAVELRRDFDRTFAEHPSTEMVRHENLLMLRLGEDCYIVRVAEIAGLFAGRPITSLPSPEPELLGIAGFRGTVVPIYDLGLILGKPRAASPRWFFLLAGLSAGLAFDRFEGHLRLARNALAPVSAADLSRRYVQEIAQTSTGAQPVIHLPSILETIKMRACQGVR
jgi:purine-binding chemotaxis protein CheW